VRCDPEVSGNDEPGAVGWSVVEDLEVDHTIDDIRRHRVGAKANIGDRKRRLQAGLTGLFATWAVTTHRQSPGCQPFPRLGRVRAPSLHRHYPASTVIRTHPPSTSAGAGPRGFTVGAELPLLATIADFPCCALLMSRACCHHCPGGISGCVSRSLHRRRRPSPLLWRVGSHIDAFEMLWGRRRQRDRRRCNPEIQNASAKRPSNDEI
jgi:hypothetical protein